MKKHGVYTHIMVSAISNIRPLGPHEQQGCGGVPTNSRGGGGVGIPRIHKGVLRPLLRTEKGCWGPQEQERGARYVLGQVPTNNKGGAGVLFNPESLQVYNSLDECSS